MKLMLSVPYCPIFIKICLLTKFLFVYSLCFSQSGESVFRAFDLNKDLEEQLPSLYELIDLATSYHPTIKINEELVGSAESRLKLARKSWTNQMRGYFDYGYGNQVILATGPQGRGDLSNIANGYRAGANISLPLSEIFTRNDRIKLQKHELSATYFKKKETEIDIANQVIDVYNELILAQRLVGIRFTMQEKARANLLQMEMDFKTGNIDAGTYMRNMEISTIAQSEYENAKKNFLVAAQKLEILIGQPLDNIER